MCVRRGGCGRYPSRARRQIRRRCSGQRRDEAVGILLSLAAAFTYGSADFLGGVVTRRVNVLVVVLVSSGEGAEVGAHDAPPSARAWARLSTLGIPQAVGAGLCFGAFFILVERAGPSGGLWPIVGVRIVSTIAMLAAILIVRPSF